MGEITDTAADVYRDMEAPGSTVPHEPVKSEIRGLFALVDEEIEVIRQQLVESSRYARDYPPGCNGVYYGDVWPSSLVRVAAARMGDPAVGDYLLIRCFHDNIVDEYVLRDPKGYSGVDGGWYLWSHSAYVMDRFKRWMESPVPQGAVTNSDWALRIGAFDQPYHSGGDGPVYAYAGFGHGRCKNIPANNAIVIDGAGTNYQSLANWPVGRGALKFANRIVITSNFKLTFITDSTDRVTMDVTQGFGLDGAGTNRSFYQLLEWQALTANVGWQDSTFPLIAAQQSIYVDRAKLSGKTEVVLNRDGNQKGNWSGLAASGNTDMQFYADNDRTIIMRGSSLYGPPMREDGVSVSPAWRDNQSSFAHVTDDEDYAKFRMYLNSSEEVPPRTANEMEVGTVYSAYGQRLTIVSPSGPA